MTDGSLNSVNRPGIWRPEKLNEGSVKEKALPPPVSNWTRFTPTCSVFPGVTVNWLVLSSAVDHGATTVIWSVVLPEINPF